MHLYKTCLTQRHIMWRGNHIMTVIATSIKSKLSDFFRVQIQGEFIILPYRLTTYSIKRKLVCKFLTVAIIHKQRFGLR